MMNTLIKTRDSFSSTKVKRGFATFAVIVFSVALAVIEAPGKDRRRTAAGNPAEGKLESFLGEPKLDIQQVHKGGRFPNILAAVESTPWEFKPDQNIIPAPANPADWPAFREQLQAWREQTKRRLNYSDVLYRKPEFAWAAASFACCFLMMCDETFYDPRSGAYTADAFLDHGQREFGGYDSLVLWHAYPRIGVDDRNQFDFYRDMPGGLNGLRELSRRCHRRNVKMFIDYNPWDTGTRRESQIRQRSMCQ